MESLRIILIILLVILFILIGVCIYNIWEMRDGYENISKDKNLSPTYGRYLTNSNISFWLSLIILFLIIIIGVVVYNLKDTDEIKNKYTIKEVELLNNYKVKEENLIKNCESDKNNLININNELNNKFEEQKQNNYVLNKQLGELVKDKEKCEESNKTCSMKLEDIRKATQGISDSSRNLR